MSGIAGYDRVPIDLTGPPLHVHLIGIGGAGMSAIAHVLVAMGHRVSGSDAGESAALRGLREVGVDAQVGHAAEQVTGADVVGVSTAIGADNVEVVAAHAAGIPVAHRYDLLAAIGATRRTLSISGTHGKTTTSALVTLALDGAGLDPSFIIGGNVAGFGTGSRWTDGEWLVLEADESDSTFLAPPRAGAVVTNIEPDHLDHHGSFEGLVAAFERFVAGTDGPVVVCADDLGAAPLVAVTRPDGSASEIVTYGTSELADVVISEILTSPAGMAWTVTRPDGRSHRLSVPLPGMHLVRNATAAFVLATAIGASPEGAAAGLARYGGVGRRFERRGEAAGITFIDDYAHMPTEVRAVLDAAAAVRGDGRIVAVFQPHRYSRTAAVWQDYAEAFDGADVVVFTEIYAAGETPIEGVDGSLVAGAVRAARPGAEVVWLPTRSDLVAQLPGLLRAGDICLTLGAGDLTTLPDQLLAVLDDPIAAELRAAGVDVTTSVALGPFTTYRVGGPARWFVEAHDVAELSAVAGVVSAHGLDVVVVGNGSNLLVADAGFDGVAVRLGSGFDEMTVDGTTVRVGGGAALPVVARRTVAAGLAGFEWAVGVPGTIGGAVRMNAGGHGSDMAASLREVRVVDLGSGQDVVMSAEACELGYRSSALRSSQVVVEAVLDLAPGGAIAGEGELAEIVRWRRQHQPGGQNAGSVFTNPAGDSAGRLIDTAGCRGRRHGSAAVSDKHANFIQADPDGSADDVAALMAEVRRLVVERHGVDLHAETVMVGFTPDVVAAAGGRP